MPGKIYKLCFNISITIPWFITSSVSFFIDEKWSCGIGALIIVFVICFFQSVLLKWSNKNLTIKNINVTNVDGTKDNWFFIYLCTYIIPFFDNVKSINFDYFKYIAIAIILLGLVIKSNTNVNNPYLLMIGYHVYEIDTQNGIKYTLLSKRKIRNKDSIQNIRRLSEYVLMEV